MSGFGYRVSLLLVLMTVFAVIDYRRNKNLATKPGEYGFILLAGILGALVGLVNDSITVSISPDYFIYGKDLQPGNDLRWRAEVFGAEEGMSAGIIGGAICLFATAQRPGMSGLMCVLLRSLWMPLIGAVLLGMTLPMIAGTSDPLGLSNKLNSFLNGEQIARFLRVWWIHLGLYAGMAAGLTAMIMRIRSQR